MARSTPLHLLYVVWNWGNRRDVTFTILREYRKLTLRWRRQNPKAVRRLQTTLRRGESV